MSVERQLDEIRNRADLKAFVDELPDDVKGIVMTTGPDGWNYHHIGDISFAESVWLANMVIHDVITDSGPGEDEGD